jgi:hypothetical protein
MAVVSPVNSSKRAFELLQRAVEGRNDGEQRWQSKDEKLWKSYREMLSLMAPAKVLTLLH